MASAPNDSERPIGVPSSRAAWRRLVVSTSTARARSRGRREAAPRGVRRRLRRGEFGELENLGGLGQLLIGLRIAKGITQRQLAERLGVSETMVSRDERNEYHGITVDRARRVLDALGARLVTRVQLDRSSAPGTGTSR